MTDRTQVIMRAADSIRAKTDFVPEVVLVLGSGLGDFARTSKTDVCAELDFSEVAGFPRPTAPGHAGKLLFGTLAGVRLCLISGRVHLYEGHSPQDAVLYVQTLAALGAKTLILTNAAGGINPAFSRGDLMLLTDHISSFVPSPLVGINPDFLGPRFPDLTDAYDPALRETAHRAAEACGIDLKEGVYLQTSGPQFESPAEIRMYRTLGADAVGMSTAIETVAARHAGMRVLALSCITNLACGLSDAPITHAEVVETGKKCAEDFSRLMRAILAAIKDA